MTEKRRISRSVAERLGLYVYLLRDPRDATVFYVGRGRGERVLMHEWDAVSAEWPSDKRDLIREICSSGLMPEVYFVRLDLPSEDAAIEVEAALIDALRVLGHPLTNLVRGAFVARGIRRLDEVVRELNAKPVQISEAAAIVKIEKLWDPNLDDAQLWEAARKWWTIKPWKSRPQTHPTLLVAVARGLVRGAWAVSGSEPGLPSDADPDAAYRRVRLGDLATQRGTYDELCRFSLGPHRSELATLLDCSAVDLLQQLNWNKQQVNGYFDP